MSPSDGVPDTREGNVRRFGRLNLSRERLAGRIRDGVAYNPVWQFYGDVWRLIWAYRAYSLAIFAVTIFQEFAALWPVSLLGQFIDRLESGDLGHIVWVLLGASLFYPGLLRFNVSLRHKMFYETDFRKRVEMVLKVSDQGGYPEMEAAGAAHTRVVNAVSGITNATYYVLGNFTPVIIKITIVAGSLLGYNRFLGLVYLASLLVPALMTILFNKLLRVLRDSQYSIIGEVSGSGIRAISDKNNPTVRRRFLEAMQIRKRVLISLIYKDQFYTYLREAALVGSQFAVVFLALGMRTQIGMTPGDFTKIFGYTAQVAASFISAASCLDAIISYSRAYHVYAIAKVTAETSEED
jgi:hypothetical protein